MVEFVSLQKKQLIMTKRLFFLFNRQFALWLCRPNWQKFFRHGHKLMLRGLGINNADGDDVTGEDWLLSRLKKTGIKTVVDVGANVSVYGFSELPEQVQFLAFEPNPETFAQLQQKNYPKRVKLFSLAVGDKNKLVKLYDFADDADLKSSQPTATLASINRQVIEEFHHQKAKAYSVKQVTLDKFIATQKVNKIDLLKIDVEGYELTVLKGAKQLIAEHKIELIQFEFNEMHVYHRVFFKDFVDLLHDYTFYRLSPNGLLPLPTYRPLTHEIFAFQNILAISHKHFDKWLLVFRTADS